MTKKQIFYTFVIPGLFIQFIGASFYFVLFSGTGISNIIYTLTKILIILWPLYWVFRRDKIKQITNRKQSIIYGLIFGLAVSALIFIIFNIFFEYFLQSSADITKKARDLDILNHYILFSLFLSITHSALEEYYWRWFIFKGLQTKLQPLLAAIISSLAFSLHHFIVLSQFFNIWITILFGIVVGVGGLFWCLIYHKTKSIIGSWIAHILVDLAVMTVGYILIF